MDPVMQSSEQVRPSVVDLYRQLIDDVRAYISAEGRVYGIQAKLAQRAIVSAVVYGLGTLVFALAAMIALVVGLLLFLSPITGAGWATVIIVLGCLVIAALLIVLIRLKVTAVKRGWKRRHDGG